MLLPMSECPATVVEDVADALVELDTDVVRRYDDAVFYMDALGHRRGAGVDSWAGADCTLDLRPDLGTAGAGRAVALPRLARVLATHCAGLA